MDNFLLLPRALAAFAFDLAFALSVGTLVAHFCLQEALPILRRCLAFSAAVMLLAIPAQLWLTTASMLASASPHDVIPQLTSVLTGTHAGRILIPAFALTLLLLLVARLRRWPLAATTLLFALAAVRAASGHAAADGDFTLKEAIQFLHLTSIALWSGGILVSGLILQAHLTTPESLTRFTRRLSHTATLAVAVVFLSGLYNAWQGLGATRSINGNITPLAHTQWGLLLTAKSAFVLVALGLGGNNRCLLARNPVLIPADTLSLRRSVRLEAIAMLAILLLSAFLANSPPATGT